MKIKEEIIKIIQKADSEDGCRREWLEEWADQILELFSCQKQEVVKGIEIAQLLAEEEHAITTAICLQDILEKLNKKNG